MVRGDKMTKSQADKYESAETLRKIFEELKGRKFKLDCGHHVTFGTFLGNNITVYNGKKPEIICSECGY
jgi:ribosomal protein S19